MKRVMLVLVGAVSSACGVSATVECRETCEKIYAESSVKSIRDSIKTQITTCPRSLIFLDELDQAPRKTRKLLTNWLFSSLGGVEYRELQDLDASQTIFIIATNAHELYHPIVERMQAAGGRKVVLRDYTPEQVMGWIRDQVNEMFFERASDRVDQLIPFLPFDEEAIMHVMHHHLRVMGDKLVNAQRVKRITFADEIPKIILSGWNMTDNLQEGARYPRAFIKHEVEKRLLQLMDQDMLKSTSSIELKEGGKQGKYPIEIHSCCPEAIFPGPPLKKHKQRKK